MPMTGVGYNSLLWMCALQNLIELNCYYDFQNVLLLMKFLSQCPVFLKAYIAVVVKNKLKEDDVGFPG